MNGRIYDPLIGRFMSADPYIQAPYNLKSFNRYSYVWNNPLKLVDLNGYDARDTTMESFVTGDNTTNGGTTPGSCRSNCTVDGNGVSVIPNKPNPPNYVAPPAVGERPKPPVQGVGDPPPIQKPITVDNNAQTINITCNGGTCTLTIREVRLAYTGGPERVEWQKVDFDDPSLNKVEINLLDLIPAIAKKVPGAKVSVEGAMQKGEIKQEVRVDSQESELTIGLGVDPI